MPCAPFCVRRDSPFRPCSPLPWASARPRDLRVVRGVLLKPLPYLEPDRIVSIWEHNLRRNRPRNVVGAANFQAWRERSKGFDHIGMVGPSRLTMMLNGQPEEVAGLAASADVFLAIGVRPVLGRLYTPDEDIEGKDAVILLSHEFWQSRLAAAPTYSARRSPRAAGSARSSASCRRNSRSKASARTT